MSNYNDEGYGYDSHEGGAQPGNDPRARMTPRQQPPQDRRAPNAYQDPYARPVRPAAGGYVPATMTARRDVRGSSSAYDQYARGNVNYGVKPRHMSRGKKAAIAIAVILVLAAIAAGVAYGFTQMRKAEVNADLHSMDEEELEAVDSQLTGHTSFSEPFTMLLLGSDERWDDPDMGARTDTIILVRVDPSNKAVSMVSIPRDTMVQIPGVGTAKINAAYYYGGAAGTISAVKELCGVDIDHYAAVSFEGLVELVNAVGGIDVVVDERIEDEKAGDAIVEAGPQHLNGEQALVLARSRDFADGDYTRQVNQRKVIMGIVERAMNAPATELTGLIQASTGFIQTDSGIDFDWIFSLADQMRHTNVETPLEVTSTTLPSAPAYVGDVSYVIKDSAGTAELMTIFMAAGDVSQPLTQSSIGTDIANAGGTSGPTGGGAAYYEETYYDDGGDYYYEEEYDDGGGLEEEIFIEDADVGDEPVEEE